MNRILVAIGVLSAAFLLQVGVSPYVAIAGVTPNFFVIAAVAVALIAGPNEGATIGFAGGLLYDMVGMTTVGPMALVLAIAGYVAGVLQQNMFAEGWVLPITTLGIVSFVGELSYLVVISVLGIDAPFWRSLFTLSIPGALYTTMVGLAFYPPTAKLMGRRRPVSSIKRLG